MLKLAMVADREQLQSTAGESRTPHLVALSRGLVDVGHDVTVFVRQGRGSQPDDSGLQVHRYRGDLGVAMASFRPDLVHAHSRSVAGAAMTAARRLGVPFVLSAHTRADVRDPAVLRGADQVLATFSDQVPVLTAAGVARPNISIVPHGVDIDHFNPDGEHADRQRKQRLIALGDVVWSSGFGTAVAALPALPDTELLLVGRFPHGKHAKELLSYARAVGVADRVRLTGPVPRADMPALLRSADLMVCSPREPTFGVAAVEGMACGVAVVASRLGGLSDTVVDGVTGTLVTPRKPRELATVLRRMLSHKAICEQQGAAGRDRAQARYSWDRVVTETVHAYRQAGATDPVVLARELAARAQKVGARATANL